MADINNDAPLATAWYNSSVQRAQVFAALSSLAAIIIPLVGLNVDIQIINAKLALVAQAVNLGFTLWGIMRRQTSDIQPLTMTKAGAEIKSEEIKQEATK